jgi:hypothetical protein
MQVVELHPPVLVRLAVWTGVGDQSSKPAGAYTLSTERGISHGNYVLDKPDSILKFTPERSGEQQWVYLVQQDGSLRDSQGTIWTARP